MAQITDLNVSPYYDDFDENDNFHRVLFRPGFSIQARELTTLQSILQGQVEQHGKHMFKEGTVVIPGQLSYSSNFTTLQLATAFASEDIVAASFYNATDPIIITGVTSGVKAKVIGFTEATSTVQPILHIQYISAGSDNITSRFSNSENITANTTIAHITSYPANVASATTHTTTAAQTGSSVKIEEGVYFIRGHFVKCQSETLVLSINSTINSGRIGFNITETLVTPETDTTLTDNATGSNNYAAKGAHRLKITVNLTSLAADSTADSSFIELMKLDTGAIVSEARNTEYSVLGDTLARRTFDESGDYTVRNFLYEAKESVTTIFRGKTNLGTYTSGATTDDGDTASDALLTLSIKPGKAYVQGYEIDKLGTTFVDINKARDFQTVNAGATTFDIGNFAFLTNMFGTPDISFISGQTTPYKEIELFTDSTVTRGTSSGYQIGVARARSIEYFSGLQGSTEAVYKLFLFDVRMFTYIILSGAPDPTLIASHSSGVQIKGVSSGATGLIHSSSYTNVGSAANQFRFPMTNVVGTFQKGEKIIASDSADTGKIVEGKLTAAGSQVDLTIADTERGQEAIVTHDFREARSLSDGTANKFTADLVLSSVDQNGIMLLDATDTSATDTSDKTLDEEGSPTVGLENQKVARLIDPEKNTSLFKLPKNVIKTLLTATNGGATDTQFTVRRQFIGSTDTNGAVTFSAGSNEVFVPFATKDYTLSVITAGAGSAVNGDVILLTDSKISGEGGTSITITDSTLLGNNASVKVTATILKTSVTAKAKSTNLSKQLAVIDIDVDGAYGTRATDADISFGRADVYRLQAIFDSESTSAATTPSLTLTTTTGTFVRGERITGGTSGALGRTISTSTPLSYTLINGARADDFVSGETITGIHSGATAVISAITVGSKNITNLFTLDTGQRDNFYDVSRLVRKPGSSVPLGKLLIVYDFLEHGAGDVFTVDSYTSLNGQMQYKDIPVFSSTRVDPDDPEPTGVFDLRDTYDFRPRVENITGASATLTDIDQITGSSFNFENRQFDGIGATTVDTPQPSSILQSDFEFYLPKRATLFLSKDGNFNIVEGVSAENPELPKDLDNALKLATLNIPAFTFSPSEIVISRFKTQRFTMRDIGRLQERIENVEYYTALSLLEKDAASFEVRNSTTSLNRFKSGFVVDNFTGHRVGDALNKDYKIAVDQQRQELRPKSVLRNSALDVGTLTNTKKTGDLITLDYTDQVLVTQPYATRVENIQPYLVAGFTGKLEISPTGDEWFETEAAPALIINRDGDFDTFAAQNANAIGTVWNAWETQWSGVTTVNLGESLVGVNQRGDANFVSRALDVTTTALKRIGTQSFVGSRTSEESIGNKTISRGIVPFIRPRVITFIGTCFAPNARLYVFFDKQNVSSFITPSSSSFTTDSTIVAGSPLIANASGSVEGSFQIPDFRGREAGTVPQFRTGDVEFRVTTSETNARSGPNSAALAPFSAATAIYKAKGILETTQETIVSTREPTLVQTSVDQETTRTTIGDARITSRRFARARQQEDGGTDPLAQTFKIDIEGGTFITKFDFFFAAKDANLPVWCELRNVVNGYPGPKILPFGRKVLNPSEVNLNSTTGTTATTFTFDSPVYLQADVEYCIVLLTNSLDYRVWISQMGETDVSGTNRVVSKQPTLGVLFKSQNNRTWNAIQMEDLKFTMHRAKFLNAIGTIALSNKSVNYDNSITAENGTSIVDGRLLGVNPLQLTHNSTVLKVKHKDHGMYSASNNVTITGVKSQIQTTLSTAITSTANVVSLVGTIASLGFEASSLSSRCYIRIGNEIMFGTIDSNTIKSLTRGDDGTTAAAHTAGATVEFYQILKTPLVEINKTHLAIANIDTNSYTISLTTAPTITGSDATPTAEVGLNRVYATENIRFETIKPIVSVLELPLTTITSKLRTTSATSPSGSESSFNTQATGETIQLNENFKFETSRMVCSNINETNELAGAKSLFLDLTFSSVADNLSPVLDTDRMSIVAAANILDEINSSGDVFPTTDYVPSTTSLGDNNSAIYITKKVALQNPANSIKVLFDANRPATSDIKVLFKILPSAASEDFDELDYEFFNTTGSPDTPSVVSLTDVDFQENEYTAGTKDDGTGVELPEFTQFSIKIVLQGTNAAQPPRIKDLRIIALAE